MRFPGNGPSKNWRREAIGYPGHLEAVPPANRRSRYKTLRKLWRWAFNVGHVEHDPMARLKPLDTLGVNNEVLRAELFERFCELRKVGKD